MSAATGSGIEGRWAELLRLLGDRVDPSTTDDVEVAVEVDGRRLYATVLPFGPDSSVVQVMAPLVAGVADSDELCEAVATAELAFGRLLLFDDGSGGRSVLHVVRFHQDQLCAAVLEHALREVAATAARLEPDLEARFGATFTLEGP